MLKKVMIICIALSFVFIGGIDFALAGDCDGTQKRNKDRVNGAQNRHGHGPGPAPNSGDGISDGPGWDFISHDSSIILAADQTRDRDRARDGSCLDS
ncbi:MAG: hypothetical protein JRE64_23395 [Deltaproteobacteria bacterium]|jgi:hypothetical protein|nr:hypothetical protein [Deltaproteobacteria bacterium]